MSFVDAVAEAICFERWGEAGHETTYWDRSTARAVIAACRPVVSTVEELDALPEGAVIHSGDNWRGSGAWTKGSANGDTGWFHWALEFAEAADEIPLPAVVLWTPETGEP